MALITGDIHTYSQNTHAFADVAVGPNDEFFVAYKTGSMGIAVDGYDPATQSWTNFAGFSAGDFGSVSLSDDLDLVTTADGHLHIVFRFDNGDGQYPFDEPRGVGYGEFDGNTWTFSIVDQGSNASGWHNFDDPRLVVDGSGNVHVAYNFADATSHDYYIKYATNSGGTFQSEVRASFTDDTDPDINEIHRPILNLESDGTLHLTYFREDNVNGSGGNPFYQTKAPGLDWSSEVRLDGAAGVVNPNTYADSVVDSDGNIHLFYTLDGAVYDLNNSSGAFVSDLAIPASANAASVRGYQEVGGVEYLVVTDDDGNATLFDRADANWSEYMSVVAGERDTDVAINNDGQVMLVLTSSDLREIDFATGPLAAPAPSGTPVATASGGTTSATEGQSAVVDGLLTVSDADSSTLASATATISGNFKPGEDVLAFANDGSTMGNVLASYNAMTGMLSLTSPGATATVAQWQAALRSVTYTNTSDAPSTDARTISFSVNDGAETSATATKSINVADINDAPTVTLPASVSVSENGATALTDISFADPDSGSSAVTVTLSVPEGALGATIGDGVTVGGTPSALTLTGSITAINALVASGGVYYGPVAGDSSSKLLTVSIDDGGHAGAGGSLSDVDTVTIDIAAVAPIVASVSVPASGNYKIGDVVSFTVNFSESVTVDTSGGTPGIGLVIGSSNQVATYTSGSGSSALTFNYTVQAGDLDANGITVESLGLNGGSITDANGNDAVLTLNAVGSTANVSIDGVAPTIESLGLHADGNYRTGDKLEFTVAFSEKVVEQTGTHTPRLLLELDRGGEVYADYVSGGGSEPYVFAYTVTADQRDTNGIEIKAFDVNGGVFLDSSGNALDVSLPGSIDTTGIRVNVPTGGPSPEPEPEEPTIIPGGAIVVTEEPNEDGTPVTVTGNPDTIDEVQIAGSVTLGDNLENAYLLGSGDYTVTGNDLDNVIYGNLGNTMIVASGGNDTIDGGWGSNTVRFAGNAEDYTVEIVDGFALVTNLITGDVSRLSNIQQLTFDDGDQPLFATSQVVLAGLYETVLGRSPDPEGFAYWMSQSADGETVGEMAAAFLASQEFDERDYEPDPASFINDLYEQFLDRPADTAGLAYWVERVEAGAGYAEVAVNFVLSAEVGERLDALFSRTDWIDAA